VTAPVEPLPRSRPYWLLIAAACLVPAALDVLQSSMQARLAGRPARWQDLTFQGGEWLFFGILTPFIYLLAQRFPLRRATWKRALAVHALGALALCVGWASLGLLLGWVLRRYPAEGHLPSAYLSWLLTSLPWSVFLYFAVLGCVYAFTYFVAVREREAQQARLAAQLAEAKLGALRMQLNPHFLFNSLNAIAVLVRDRKTREASRMLELLGGVLRQVLYAESRPEVTLAEELRFLEQYLEIEQVRFSDRLQVRWSVAPALRDVLVPEFILQPLVENAIRHGVAKRSDAGAIEIAASTSEGDVVLSVQDDGPGYDPERDEAGVGLANIRSRLETLFGDAGCLQLVRAEGGGTKAMVRLPLRRRPDA
jgi:signal transduction histidine kinase